MRAKHFFLTAIVAVMAIFASSCNNDEPKQIAPILDFRINIVNEDGKSLVTDDNFNFFNIVYSIYHNGEKHKLNAGHKQGYTRYDEETYRFYFGTWQANNITDSFTINYGDIYEDKITFKVNNLSQESTSYEVYLNDENITDKIELDKYHEMQFIGAILNITIVKPNDFLDKLKEL